MNMQEINPENRFEKLLIRYKKYLKPIDYLIKIIGIVVILLILLEFFSFVAVSTYNFLNTGARDSRINSGVYRDKKWAPDCFMEFWESSNVEYYPYVGFRRLPSYKGNYVNLDNESIRKTFNPCFDSSKKPIRIFIFGGSTLWGTGSRDRGTIPSYLSKYLCENDYNVEVTNFGETGYTNSQEMIKLQLELRKRNMPDIVIFYDGVNDVYSSYQNGVAGLPQNIENRKKEFNSRNRFSINGLFPNFFKVVGKITKTLNRKNVIARSSDKNLNIETAKIYLNNIRIIKSLEDDFGFKSFFYWQPTVYTKQELSDDEKTKIDDYEEGVYEDYNAVSSLVNISNNVISLINIFDREEDTVFIDWCHLSEEGNSIIAHKISEDIIKYLEAR